MHTQIPDIVGKPITIALIWTWISSLILLLRRHFGLSGSSRSQMSNENPASLPLQPTIPLHTYYSTASSHKANVTDSRQRSGGEDESTSLQAKQNENANAPQSGVKASSRTCSGNDELLCKGHSTRLLSQRTSSLRDNIVQKYQTTKRSASF